MSARSKKEVCESDFKTPGILKQAGITVALTTDHPVCRLQYLPLCAALAAKLKSGDRTAGKDEDIFRCASVNGASYAQVNAGITEGCAADILLVELDHCRMVGDYNLTANLVYSADSSVMHTLICNGRVIMENRRVPGEEEIIAEARRCCDKFRR
jgi:5-methylthioadenosine/S-adenosylhomocysteine deaminase